MWINNRGQVFCTACFKILNFLFLLRCRVVLGEVHVDLMRSRTITRVKTAILNAVCGEDKYDNTGFSTCLRKFKTREILPDGLSNKIRTTDFVASVLQIRSRRVRSTYEYCQNNSKVPHCCVRRYYINFKDDMGWDWVHAPTGVYANICEGECYPNWGSPSTHAALMARLARLKGKRHIAPKCVPRDYEAVTILYYKDGKPKVRRIDDLIVTACKCK